MAIEAHGLTEMITALTEDAITVHLHTGDPGSAGTANRVPTAAFGSVTIAAGATGWTIAGGVATAKANLDFGTAGQAVTGVSWMSMFKGSTFFARRALSASQDIANTDPVVLVASSVKLEVSSSDS